jgi:hypothetical protein
LAVAAGFACVTKALCSLSIFAGDYLASELAGRGSAGDVSAWAGPEFMKSFLRRLAKVYRDPSTALAVGIAAVSGQSLLTSETSTLAPSSLPWLILIGLSPFLLAVWPFERYRSVARQHPAGATAGDPATPTK